MFHCKTLVLQLKILSFTVKLHFYYESSQYRSILVWVWLMLPSLGCTHCLVLKPYNELDQDTESKNLKIESNEMNVIFIIRVESMCLKWSGGCPGLV